MRLSTSVKAAALPAGLLLALSPLTPAAAAPVAPAAAAASCPQPTPHDNDKVGYGYISKAAYPKPMRSGPSQNCYVITDIYPGVKLWYHCYVTNSAGNTWTHLRIDGTQVSGWVWDDNLDDGGSFVHC
jgi:hypothetical protein